MEVSQAKKAFLDPVGHQAFQVPLEYPEVSGFQVQRGKAAMKGPRVFQVLKVSRAPQGFPDKGGILESVANQGQEACQGQWVRKGIVATKGYLVSLEFLECLVQGVKVECLENKVNKDQKEFQEMLVQVGHLVLLVFLGLKALLGNLDSLDHLVDLDNQDYLALLASLDLPPKSLVLAKSSLKWVLV
ncbi:hypothetical protein DPEC_G00155230 [Dallia pectoralis]|uniref:Uncharacterized protein n=1 Tax=Dallia pectoralis TaxID=75939 RepID=A0ACC2GKA6_DALPE|nr:hypothetical protein DPEC_G00155230 [Dallia pectoralis]